MDGNDATIALAAQMQYDPDWNTVPRILLDYDTPLAADRAALFAKRLTKPFKRSHLHATLAELTGGAPAAQRMTIPIGEPALAQKLPLRILLAEDNHVNQKVVLALLGRMGYRADVAGNGLEALDSVLRQPYDLVFLDIQMPEMGGIEAAKVMRKTMPDECPVLVALTANAFTGAEQEYLSQGFDFYLSKPLLPAPLRQVIVQAAEKRAKDQPEK
jgi:CheY-like chemotaxis protein